MSPSTMVYVCARARPRPAWRALLSTRRAAPCAAVTPKMRQSDTSVVTGAAASSGVTLALVRSSSFRGAFTFERLHTLRHIRHLFPKCCFAQMELKFSIACQPEPNMEKLANFTQYEQM